MGRDERFSRLRRFTAVVKDVDVGVQVLDVSVVPLREEDLARAVAIRVRTRADVEVAYAQAQQILLDDYAGRGITLLWPQMTPEERASIASFMGFRYERQE
jgi:hypothetical protein